MIPGPTAPADNGAAMSDAAVYSGLFLAALAAATLLPAQSELLLAGLLVRGEQPVWALLAVAWAGNTGGSAINWLLGVYLYHLRDRRWFLVKQEALDRARGWYRKYGRWSLWLSWAPVIGDPLTLAAGILREPLKSFLLIVGTAKLLRYLAVATLAISWAG